MGICACASGETETRDIVLRFEGLASWVQVHRCSLTQTLMHFLSMADRMVFCTEQVRVSGGTMSTTLWRIHGSDAGGKASCLSSAMGRKRGEIRTRFGAIGLSHGAFQAKHAGGRIRFRGWERSVLVNARRKSILWKGMRILRRPNITYNDSCELYDTVSGECFEAS